MVRYQCAYRFDNGDLVGFIGYGFADSSARDNATAQIRRECRVREEEPILYGPECRFLDSRKWLTAAEYAAVRRQWREMKAKARKFGASIV